MAASQKALVPPLPRETTNPFGRPKSSASPVRTRRTTSFTGGCLCEVPSWGAAASAATCSARTFVGPLPNRPSFGLRFSGMTITEPDYSEWSRVPVDYLSRARHIPDRPRGGADVAGRRADQAAGQLLLHDVRRPARGPRAGEHRRGDVRGDLREVQDDRRPELDVGLEDAVRTAGAQFGERGGLERERDFVPGRAEFLRGAPQHPRPGVLGPVHPVTEAHQAPVVVEDGLHVTFGVAGPLDLLDHVEHAGGRAAVQRPGQ